MEIGKLDLLTRQAKAQKGSSVIVTGPPGIGKTKLLQAFQNQIFRKGAVTLEAPPGYSPEAAYGGFAAMISRYLIDCGHQLRHLMRVVQVSQLQVLARIVPDLKEIFPYDPPTDVSRLSPRTVIIDVLRRLSRFRPVIAFIDDLDFRSEEDQYLFFELTRLIFREAICLIGASQTETGQGRFSRNLSWGASQGNLEIISLSGLDSQETKQYINEVLDVSLNEVVSEHVHGITGGNPLLISQLIKGLNRLGIFNRQEIDKNTLSDALPIAMASSLDAMINHNLTNLTAGCLEILHTAALAGNRFNINLLSGISQESPQTINRHLYELMEKRLVEPAEPGHWQFSADLIRRIILKSMPEHTHKDILRKYAVLLKDHDDTVSVNIRLRCLADLAEVSEADPESGHLLYKAGIHAQEAFDNRLSMRLFLSAEKAAVRFQDKSLELLARSRYYRLLRFMGNRRDACRGLEKLKQEMSQGNLKSELTVVLYDLASVKMKLGDYAGAEQALDELDDLVATDPEFRQTARYADALLIKAQVAYRQGKTEKAISLLASMDKFPTENPYYHWMAFSIRAGIEMDQNHFSEFWHFVSQAGRFADRLRDPFYRSQLDLLTGTVETVTGHLSSGEQRLRMTARQFWNSGYTSFYADSMVQLGLNLALQGKFDEALDMLQTVLAAIQWKDAPVTAILARAYRARIYNDLYQHDSARVEIYQGREILKQVIFTYGELLLNIEDLRAQATTDHPESILAEALETVKVAAGFQGQEYGEALVAAAGISRIANDQETAFQHLREAVGVLDHFPARAVHFRYGLLLAFELVQYPADLLSDELKTYSPGPILKDALDQIRRCSAMGWMPVLKDWMDWKKVQHVFPDAEFFNPMMLDSAAEISPIRITVCGDFEVFLPGRNDPLEKGEWGSDRARQIFCLLIIAGPDKGLRRETIGLKLWPDMSTKRMTNAFHIAMSHLRKALSDPRDVIEYSQDIYRINPDYMVVDYWEIREWLETARNHDRSDQPHLAREAREQAVNRYNGELLPHRSEIWVDTERHWLHREIRQALIWLARREIFDGKTEEAMGYAQRLINLDPADEEAHRILIQSLIAQEDRSGAIRQYRRLKAILLAELDVEPEPETRSLIQSIQ